MHKNNPAIAIMSIALAIVFHFSDGCSGKANDRDGGADADTDADSDTDTDTNTGVSYKEIQDVIDTGMQKFESEFHASDLETAFSTLADYFGSQEIVEDVVLSTGNGYISFVAGFENGILFTVPVAYVTKDLAEQMQKPAPSSKSKQLLGEIGIPQGKLARVMSFQGFENAFTCDILNDNDYSCDYTPTGGVAMFEGGLCKFQILYISSHGLFFKWKGDAYTLTETDEKRNADRDLDFMLRGDFEAVRIVLSVGVLVIDQNDIFVSEDAYYAITNKFITHYNSNCEFENESLVYIDTCHGFTRDVPSHAPPMASAFESLGAGHYLGWEGSVATMTALENSQFVFSRLLGDSPAYFKFMKKVDPPPRPWSLGDIWTFMTEKGMDIDKRPPPGARMHHGDFTYGSRDLLLKPIIDDMTVDVDTDNSKQTLEIRGQFGDKEDTVKSCSLDSDGRPSSCNELNCTAWEKDYIEVQLEGSSDLSGAIVVEVDQKQSNAHPLSQWNMAMTLKGQQSNIGPDCDITLDLSFLGEIAQERTSPGGNPYGPYGDTSAPLLLASKADYKFSGEFETPTVLYYYPEDKNTGTVKLGSNGSKTLQGAVLLKPNNGTADFQVVLLLEVYVEEYDPSTMQLIKSHTDQVALPAVFTANLSDQYGGIIGGTTNIGALELKWEDTEPKMKPSDKTHL